jgi:hypothetical protein
MYSSSTTVLGILNLAFPVSAKESPKLYMASEPQILSSFYSFPSNALNWDRRRTTVELKTIRTWDKTTLVAAIMAWDWE